MKTNNRLSPQAVGYLLLLLASASMMMVGVVDRFAHDDLGALEAPIAELKNDTVTCGTTATLIHGNLTGAPGAKPRSMLLVNNSATQINIGGSGVTTSTGVDLCDGCSVDKVMNPNTYKAWCVAGSGTNIQVVWGQ